MKVVPEDQQRLKTSGAVIQVHDGEWINPTPQQGHSIICCDCGLVHSIDFKVEDGHVEFRAYRDDERTEDIRATHPELQLIARPPESPFLMRLEVRKVIGKMLMIAACATAGYNHDWIGMALLGATVILIIRE